MATNQQLSEQTLNMLRETSSDSHFTSAQITGYLNQGVNYLAALASPPEDVVDVAAELNIGAYQLPSDNLVIQQVYYGTATTANDFKPLKPLNKDLMKELYPNWLDETITNAGEPTVYLKLDNQTLYIHPRPNADHVKRIFLFYGFTPAPMAADGDKPQISLPYHSILPFYACRLAYYALSNAIMAKEMMAAFLGDYNSIKDNVDKGIEESFRFKWGVTE